MTVWEIVAKVSLAYAVFVIVRHRRAIVENLRRVPLWARILLGAALILCAAIPGPLDDFIVLGIIKKLAKD